MLYERKLKETENPKKLKRGIIQGIQKVVVIHVKIPNIEEFTLKLVPYSKMLLIIKATIKLAIALYTTLKGVK